MNAVLSFVIVEYHSIEEVCHCIDSIHASVGMPHEIIISSNSCYDKEAILALPQREGVKWVFNERNGGFAYAMNQGMNVAQGEFLVTMNPDCVINGGIEQMVAFLRENPSVGIVAPQIRDPKGNIQDTAREYVSLPNFIHRQVIRILRHKVSILDNKVDYSKAQTVDWVIGAFIMATRTAYERTGGFDEGFFMYAEDLDWCTRVRQAGLEVVYFPCASVSYKGTRRARSSRKYAKIFIYSHIQYWNKFGYFFGYPRRRNFKLSLPTPPQKAPWLP